MATKKIAAHSKGLIITVTKIRLNSAEDLRQFINIAWECPSDVGVHAPDGKIADAKSILGLIALNYNEPVLVVTEDESFPRKIKKWTVNE